MQRNNSLRDTASSSERMLSSSAKYSSLAQYSSRPAYSIPRSPSCSSGGLLYLHPFRKSRNKRYPSINLTARWASAVLRPKRRGFCRNSRFISGSSRSNPRARKTFSARSSSVNRLLDVSKAHKSALLTKTRKRKSLKWPDWSAASCRLSVNPSIFRGSCDPSGTSCSKRF